MNKWLKFKKNPPDDIKNFVVDVKYRIVDEFCSYYKCNGQLIQKSLEGEFYETGDIIIINYKDDYDAGVNYDM